MTYARYPDTEEGCFPGPSLITDGMGVVVGGGGNQRKDSPSHPVSPQEPDRKQPQERERQPGPQP